jgi:hypothetical protein
MTTYLFVHAYMYGLEKKMDLYQTPGRTTGVLRAPFTTRNPAAPGRLIAKTTLHSQTQH